MNRSYGNDSDLFTRNREWYRQNNLCFYILEKVSNFFHIRHNKLCNHLVSLRMTFNTKLRILQIN